jgi:inosine-uridine nucleoside N-ribohydrolase
MSGDPLRVISTDAGIDDALALILLHALEENPADFLLATGGNVPVADVARNCAYLKRTFGWPTALFLGTDPPGGGDIRDAANVHGPHGLGPLEPPSVELPPMARLIERLHEGAEGLDVLVLGPATDAASLLRDPALAARVRRITLMGGAFRPRDGRLGNTTPWAEFNVYMDPSAARVVIGSGRPCRLVPLDATESRLFTVDELLPAEGAHRKVRLLGELLEYLREAHVRLGSGNGVFMHDVIAAAIWAGRFEAEWTSMGVKEIPGSGERRGMMVPDGPDAPRVEYAQGFDEEAFLAAWKDGVRLL